MLLKNFFFSQKKTPANIAKERLNIIISESKLTNENMPYYFYKFKNDLLEIIRTYSQIHSNTIKIQLKEKSNDISILELNIILNKIKNE